jgi:hypothetical protein
MPDENSHLAHRDLIQAAIDLLVHIAKRVETWLRESNSFDDIDKHRIRDKELLESAFQHPNPSRRRNRAFAAYQARQNQFTEKWLERGSFFSSTAEALNSLRPVWGDPEVERLLAHLTATREVGQLTQFIENVLRWLFDQHLSASQDLTAGRQKPTETGAAETEAETAGRQKATETPGATEIKAKRSERKRCLQEYKAECEGAGRKVTDADIGRELKPNSKNPRTIVQKWRICDPRYDGYDPKIRQLFHEKPHLKNRQ